MSDPDDVLAERDQLRRWKAEALPVLDGLQDLGRALHLAPGRRITGTEAAAAARDAREKLDALAALADHMETDGYASDSDGWGHVAAREIRQVLGLTPACRCPWATGTPEDQR